MEKQLKEYLLLISDEIGLWHDLILKYEFEKIKPLNSYILNMVKILIISPRKTEDVLKEQKVSFCIHDKAFFDRSILPLKEMTKEFVSYGDINSLIKAIDKDKPGLIIVESQCKGINNIKSILEIAGSHPFLPIIVLKNDVLQDKELDYLTMVGIYYYIDKGDSAEEIYDAMKVITKAYLEKKGIRLLMSPILKNKVNLLKPLPKSLYEIQEVGNDPDKSIHDMTEVISRDVALTTKILQNINRPKFGLRKTISSVQQAVSLLGKDGTMAMALQSAMYGILRFDLASYGMSIDDFYDVSYKRLRLATIWYSKISPEDLNIVSTAALIDNIGGLLISQEAAERHLTEKFKHIVMTQSPVAAEIELFHTTTEDVTAAILSHWGLEDRLINIIKYSNDLLECPDDMKKAASAIYIINQTIPVNNARVTESIVSEMEELAKELNLNPEWYRKAVEELELTLPSGD